MRKLFNKTIATLTLLSLVLSVFTPTMQAHAESGVDDYYDEEDYYSEGCDEEEFRKGSAYLDIDNDVNTVWVGCKIALDCFTYMDDSKLSVTSSDESVISFKKTSIDDGVDTGEDYTGYTCTALKAGMATITVTETHKDQTYTLLERTITVDDKVFLNNRWRDCDIKNSGLSKVNKAYTLVPEIGSSYLYLENFYDASWNANVDEDVKVSTDSKLLKVSTYSEKDLKASNRKGYSKIIELTGTGKGTGTAKVTISYGEETKTINVCVTPSLRITAGMYTEITLCTKFKPDVKKFYIKSLKGIRLNTAYRPSVKKCGNMWVSTICLDTDSNVKEGFYKIKVGYKGTKKTVYVDSYKKGKKNYKTSETIWVLPYDPASEGANE